MPVKKLFLSVGAMKSGTTFLFTVLGRHPEIFFTPEKELHYFAHTEGLSRQLQTPLKPKLWSRSHIMKPGQALTKEYRIQRLSLSMNNRFAQTADAKTLRRTIRWYTTRYLSDPVDHNWFERAYADAENRWCTDFSNYNAQLSDKGWEAVRQHCEELRVMYVLRDPIERIWSHMKFEFLAQGKRDALFSGELRLIENFLASASSAHARYCDVIENLRRNLAPEELFVVRLEDIVADLPAKMREIENFLGIAPYDYSDIDAGEKPNKTQDIPINRNANLVLSSALEQEINQYNNF